VHGLESYLRDAALADQQYLLERLKLLKPHQADFRRAEEAVAQATCLVELLQRRSAKKE
jgi:hypothetical protein